MTTRTGAITEIVTAIEATGEVTDARAEYDIDAVADAVLGGYDDDYAVIVDDAEFWAAVAANAR